jgi:RNA polymerase sigma-70 factor (ECF subfamily)
MLGDPELRAAMDRYATGDAAAFEPLYDGLAPRLRAMLRRQGCDPALVEDLVQQTFLRIHCARGHYRSGHAVIPWAYAIARRLMIDAWRRDRRDERKERAVAPARPPDPEEQVIAGETAHRLAHDLDELPPLNRQAFTLVKLDGLSLEQTAGKLGTTVNAIKLRIHRAYQSLRGAAQDPK